MTDLNLNTKKVARLLTDFIRDFCKKAGFKKVVLGLSGGLDSAVVAHLACRALGSKNVIGFILPYKSSNPEALKDARMIARKLGIKTRRIGITPMVDAYYRQCPDNSRLRKGNKLARERMSILYDFSAREKALVIGTGNKTEILLGYFTLHGDGACAFNPIGNLYKSQVRLLAKELGVPQRIIDKPPSADLWAGQTDEGELGISYEEVDRLLYYMVDRKYSDAKLRKLGFTAPFTKKIKNIIKCTDFKRTPPQIARIDFRK
jgi:NAD+ synthase